ncbi:hypothetical protein K492DRAFT_210940 [Lichtheimia hyalospora FSU 10163]|nr:hypothetical protein K492DRAFT_210940 [Lichtheimia hyalospora FSU 10163]
MSSSRNEKIARMCRVLNQNFSRLIELRGQTDGESASKKRKINDTRATTKVPTSAYFCFIQAEMEAAREELGEDSNMNAVVTLIAKKWNKLTLEQKEVYRQRAEENRERHERELQVYRESILLYTQEADQDPVNVVSHDDKNLGDNDKEIPNLESQIFGDDESVNLGAEESSDGDDEDVFYVEIECSTDEEGPNDQSI